MEISRREFIVASGTVAGVSTSGCTARTSADYEPGETEDGYRVVAGPGNKNVFEPSEITIKTGEVIEWVFASPGHNVACEPEASEKVELPEEAKTFSTYGNKPKYTPVDKGERFEHTFEVPGEYVYVCVPHISFGMTGTVVVEE